MIEKIRTAIWFFKRTSHWPHAFALAKRKFMPDYDDAVSRAEATQWAESRAVDVEEALAHLGYSGDLHGMSQSALDRGHERAKRSSVKMGGPGDLDLLSDVVRVTQAKRVVETGVAFGWSSLAILSAMSEGDGGELWSVDMPYPKMGNEQFVGVVVPDELQHRWTLIREPDRCGLERAIKLVCAQLDLCHYDSDKSWYGRAYAYPILWNALRPGGLFISDDIQDNFYFSKFVTEKSLPFSVIKSQNKYVGLIRKG